MSLQRIVLYALVTVLAAPSSALAQDDDLLAPLTPQKPSGTKPGKPKVKKRPAATKKPARTKTPVAKKTKAPKGGKGAKGKKPVVAEPAEDDLLAPLTPAKTELVARITGSVRGGAKLFVDGKELGQISAAPIPFELPPGEHQVVVRKPGYADFTKTLDVKPGVQTELPVALEATMGFANLSADAPGATVMVDGQELGSVPRANVLLKPGSREIEFRAPGYKPDVRNITVFAGKTYEVAGTLRPLVDTSIATTDVPKNTDLNPGTTPDAAVDPLATQEVAEVSTSKPWYGRWYVWAGVGAVVAAGAAGTYMATQGGGADPLDADRDVCGGQCDVKIGAARKLGGNGIPLPAGAFRF